MKKLAIAMTLALLFVAGDSLAKNPHGDPHKRHRKARNEHREHREHAKAQRNAHKAVRDVAHWHGGPPPWAPAHGYRRGHRRVEVRYVVPFGIATGTCNSTAIGAALGAAGGGLLGAELSDGDPRAVFGGLLAGALVGGALGDAAAGQDRNCFGQALEHAPPSQTIAWRNPDDHASYRVTPTRTYESDAGRYCREYTTSVTIGGREQTAYGTACRQPDGSWEPI